MGLVVMHAECEGTNPNKTRRNLNLFFILQELIQTYYQDLLMGKQVSHPC
jgi:hypothetical protein